MVMVLTTIRIYLGTTTIRSLVSSSTTRKLRLRSKNNQKSLWKSSLVLMTQRRFRRQVLRILRHWFKHLSLQSLNKNPNLNLNPIHPITTLIFLILSFLVQLKLLNKLLSRNLILLLIFTKLQFLIWIN